jgi:hypothetical protein
MESDKKYHRVHLALPLESLLYQTFLKIEFMRIYPDLMFGEI